MNIIDDNMFPTSCSPSFLFFKYMYLSRTSTWIHKSVTQCFIFLKLVAYWMTKSRLFWFSFTLICFYLFIFIHVLVICICWIISSSCINFFTCHIFFDYAFHVIWHFLSFLVISMSYSQKIPHVFHTFAISYHTIFDNRLTHYITYCHSRHTVE